MSAVSGDRRPGPARRGADVADTDLALTLTVLGCAGSYAGPGNACSGYLVRSEGATTVVDLGPGTLANLQLHVAIADVDAVVFTHHHPDHWLDLPILRNAMRYYLGVEGLPVYGTADALEQARVVIGDLEPTLRWTVIDPSARVTVGDQRLSFSLTDHPVETLATRVEAGGRTLVYSADTGSGWRPGDQVSGVDLLLCEATIPAAFEDRAPHLSARQAGALAREWGVGRLVVTHVAPGVDPEDQREAAAAAFGGPVDLASVNATFAV
ncbi:MAG: MBL fold metallo-hydrolase [Acidimicrobiales bacterium]